MRKLAVRLSPGTVPDFIDTFFLTTVTHKIGPNFFQLLWSHPIDMHSRDHADITPLLQARAHTLSLILEYIPAQAADTMIAAREDPCEMCSEGMYTEERGIELEHLDEDCMCDEYVVDYDVWAALKEERMAYTKILQDFLSNSNMERMQDIYAGRISIDCAFNQLTELLQFRIQYKGASKNRTHGFDAACGLLERLGIFSLSRDAEIEFVVVFEMVEAQTGEFLSTKPEVREVRIPRPLEDDAI